MKTGGKAVLNATASTVVSTVTLGGVDNVQVVHVTQEDLANGYNLSYGLARAGTEVLVGVGTGMGATKLASIGTKGARYGSYALRGWDMAQNGVNGVRGVTEMARNGVTLQNTLPLGGAGLASAGDMVGAVSKMRNATKGIDAGLDTTRAARGMGEAAEAVVDAGLDTTRAARKMEGVTDAVADAPNKGLLRVRTAGAASEVETYTARQIAAAIADDPVAYRAYLQLRNRVGTDVTLDFGRVTTGATGRVRRIDEIEIFYRSNANVREAVATFVHESRHISDLDRGIISILRPTQIGEYRAFRREFLFEHGRRPTFLERSRIWEHVFSEYPNLPLR